MLEFWYPRWVLEPIPCGYQGIMAIKIIPTSFGYSYCYCEDKMRCYL
jgi:hypothetical protein